MQETVSLDQFYGIWGLVIFVSTHRFMELLSCTIFMVLRFWGSGILMSERCGYGYMGLRDVF